MLNLFQKYRRTPSSSQRDLRQQFKDYFFAQSEHAWISENKLTRGHFETLFDRLPSALLANFMRHPLFFVTSKTYQFEGASRFQMKNTVVVFPVYEELLAKKSLEAVAFLAHELALVIYDLDEQSEKDPLMAEVEADKFVCDIGLADELESLLLSMDESAEKRLRLTYLTFQAFGVN